MSDEPSIADDIRVLKALGVWLNERLSAIEAELAVMRGTQSASRWSGDSPAMTIEPPDSA